MDNAGKVMVQDNSLNGVELGPAVELTRGWKPADRLALYTGGSGTDTLSFIYVVQEVPCSLTCSCSIIFLFRRNSVFMYLR